jgi:hypothetical protein
LLQHQEIRGRLREDHAGYLAELGSLRLEGDARRCLSRLGALRRSWAIQALAEESVVYRALESAEAASDLDIHSGERFIENELIVGLFDKLARGRPGTREWHARLKVATDLISRHMQTEQLEVFARLGNRFDAQALQRMADEYVRERERLARLEEPKAA